MGDFRELRVWQASKALAIEIYKLSASGELSRDFGLRDQMRRAAVSVCSNIAEGDERRTDRESVHFFSMARGSLAELITQFEIAEAVGYVSKESFSGFEQQSCKVGRMLGALMKSRAEKQK